MPPRRAAGYAGVPVLPLRPRATACSPTVEPRRREATQIASSGEEPIAFERVARARFALRGEPSGRSSCTGSTAYGGGLFVPFRDATSGAETYGGGRYLLDTVKGSDLGEEDGQLVLDFNFAYNPSCSYDPRWVCPLSPPANRLPVVGRGGRADAQPS